MNNYTFITNVAYGGWGEFFDNDRIEPSGKAGMAYLDPDPNQTGYFMKHGFSKHDVKRLEGHGYLDPVKQFMDMKKKLAAALEDAQDLRGKLLSAKKKLREKPKEAEVVISVESYKYVLERLEQVTEQRNLATRKYNDLRVNASRALGGMLPYDWDKKEDE
ncbi:MAG: hypothetical protein GY841_18005 [FCB group bacterium]|nr:hypothetical protein [FCB group bacterium]